MNPAEALLADRVRRAEGSRRKLSRRAYGELVGLTEQRVWAIEQGKRLKAGELDQLRPFVGDLLGEDDRGELPAPPAAEERPRTEREVESERQGLLAAHAYLLTRLEGKPAPPDLALPTRIEEAGPGDFPRIRDWIQSVHEWLDGVRDFPCGEPGCGGVTRPHSHDPETRGEDLQVPSPEHYGGAITDAPVDIYADADAVTETDYDGVLESTRTELRGALEQLSELRTEAESPPEEQPLPTEFRYVTNSELRCFKACRRQWWLAYYRRLQPATREVIGPRSVGTRVHRVLESYYTPGSAVREDPWQVFERTVQEDEQVLAELGVSDERRGVWLAEVDLARAMVEGYLEWVEVTAADAGLEVVAPEARLVANPRFPEFPDHRLLAKIDVRVTRNLDGARLFLDHKTVADLTSPQKTLHLDEQMLHYHLTEYLDLLEGGDGELRTGGALYNMLRKVKRTASARPPFYGRVEVRHNLDELRSYWSRVRETLIDLERVRAALDAGADHRQVAYPNPTRDCSWRCDYFQVCPMFDDGSRAENYLSDLYVEVNPLRRYETTAS